MKIALSTVLALGVIAAGSCVAEAQLQQGEPADTFDLDGDWLTGVDDATDIAFLSDGRGVVTRRTGQIVVVNPDGTIQMPAAATIQVVSC